MHRASKHCGMKFKRLRLGRIGSVATAIAGVFANFTNKIGKITEKLEDVDRHHSV
jgi:hypothetical protein